MTDRMTTATTIGRRAHRKHGPLTYGPDWTTADLAWLSVVVALDLPAGVTYRAFCLRAEHPRTAIAVGARALKLDDAQSRRLGSRMVYWAQRGCKRAVLRGRRRRDAEEAFAANAALPLSPETEYEDREACSVVYRALDRISAREQDMVRLWSDGATLDEIGARHGISGERVRQIVTRALARLRDAVTEGEG